MRSEDLLGGILVVSGTLRGPLGTICGPLWIQVWDFGGPKGQKYEKPRFFIGFQGVLGVPGGARGARQTITQGSLRAFLATGGDYQGGKLDFQTSGPKVPIS